MTRKSAIVTAAIAAISLGCSAVHAKELTYATFVSSEHLVQKDGIQPFVDRISQATNGDLTIKPFVGGALGGAAEMLGAARDGAVDSALILDVMTQADLPVSSMITSLYTIVDDPIAYAAAVNEFQIAGCEKCRLERESNNILGLAWVSTDPYVLMCNSDVSTLANWQGKKTFASSRVGNLVQNLGAVPVSMSTGEIYEAMQRGALECVVGSAAWMQAYNLGEVVKSIVEAPFGSYIGTLAFAMNKDSWDGLPPEQKEIVLKELSQMIADVEYSYVASGVEALSAARNRGVPVHAAEQSLLDAIAKNKENEVEAVIAQGESNGIADARQVVEGFLQSVAKWKGIMASVGNDKSAYQQAIWEEILSKIAANQ